MKISVVLNTTRAEKAIAQCASSSMSSSSPKRKHKRAKSPRSATGDEGADTMETSTAAANGDKVAAVASDVVDANDTAGNSNVNSKENDERTALVILLQTFGKKAVTLTLTPTTLRWSVDGREDSLDVNTELIGATADKEVLVVHGVRHVKGADKAVKYRFKFIDADAALEWQQSVRCAVNGAPIVGGEFSPRRIFLLVNPYGGKKKAAAIYANQVRPLLESAGCTLTMQETEYAHHATEVAEALDISLYDSFVTVSGDGLLHEALQGIMVRADWREFVTRVTIGVIPCGSGNGFAFSGGFIDISAASLVVAKGHSRPMDLAAARQYEEGGVRILWSLLMLTWGIISEIDLGSENLRFMGPARFTVAGVQNAISLPRFPARFAVLEASDAMLTRCDVYAQCTACQSTERHTLDAITTAKAEGAEEKKSSKRAKKKRGKKADSRDDDDQEEDGDVAAEQDSTTTSTSAAVTSSTPVSSVTASGYAPALMPLDELRGAAAELPSIVPRDFDFAAPPDGWTVEEDKYLHIMAGNLTDISNTLESSALAHYSDGLLDVTTLRKHGHWGTVKYLSNDYAGVIHERDSPYAQRKVRALVLEPTSDKRTSLIDIDGEPMPSMRTFYEVYPRVLNVLCKHWTRGKKTE